MSVLTIGTACALTVTLRVNGEPIAVPDMASVTGQFYGPDGAESCSPPLLALPTDEGAAWHLGAVAFALLDTDTIDLAAPVSLLQVTVADGAGTRVWRIRFNVTRPGDEAGTALFPDRAQAIESVRQMLRLGGTFESLCALTADQIWAALTAAEAEAERALRVSFSPVEILPESATQAERDAFDAAETPWIEEPGYDLEDEFFLGDRWGYLVTRRTPILAVHRLRIVYPTPASGVFDLPLDWIRLDKKYGHVRIVPGTQLFAAPLSIGILQALGGGRGIPQAVQLWYRAGLTDAAKHYPDLVDLVRRMAMLRLLKALFPAAASSISADGLSESLSIDLAKLADSIEAELERLRQFIHGIEVGFL